MSKDYETDRVYIVTKPHHDAMRMFFERPVKYKRELPVFGIPGLSVSLPDGHKFYRWSKELGHDEANHRQ